MRRAIALLALSLVASGCHRAKTEAGVAAGGADASPATALAPLDGGNPSMLSRSSATESQIEPDLAVAGDGTVATTWTDVRAGFPSRVAVRFSKDSGGTWDAAQMLASPEGRSAAHAVVATDGAGRTYIAWVGLRPGDAGGDKRDARIYVATSAPGAALVGDRVNLSERMRRGASADSPWIEVSPSGAVFVSWSYSSSGGDGIEVATTTDGKAWKHGVVIERVGLSAQYPRICASPGGQQTWVTYLDDEVGVRIRASDDGGLSWSPSRVETVNGMEEREHVARDAVSCTSDGDVVTVVYGRTRGARTDAGGSTADVDSIVVARSFDGGRTFDLRRAIDLPERGLHPQIAREPDGALDVAYYSVGPGGEAGAVRWLRIVDANPAGAPRAVRNHVVFADDRASAAWPGDYFGLEFHDGHLFVASVDASEGAPHVTFTRVASR